MLIIREDDNSFCPLKLVAGDCLYGLGLLKALTGVLSTLASSYTVAKAEKALEIRYMGRPTRSMAKEASRRWFSSAQLWCWERGLNGKEAGPQAAKAEPQTSITLITGQLL